MLSSVEHFDNALLLDTKNIGEEAMVYFEETKDEFRFVQTEDAEIDSKINSDMYSLLSSLIKNDSFYLGLEFLKSTEIRQSVTSTYDHVVELLDREMKTMVWPKDYGSVLRSTLLCRNILVKLYQQLTSRDLPLQVEDLRKMMTKIQEIAARHFVRDDMVARYPGLDRYVRLVRAEAQLIGCLVEALRTYEALEYFPCMASLTTLKVVFNQTMEPLLRANDLMKEVPLVQFFRAYHANLIDKLDLFVGYFSFHKKILKSTRENHLRGMFNSFHETFPNTNMTVFTSDLGEEKLPAMIRSISSCTEIIDQRKKSKEGDLYVVFNITSVELTGIPDIQPASMTIRESSHLLDCYLNKSEEVRVKGDFYNILIARLDKHNYLHVVMKNIRGKKLIEANGRLLSLVDRLRNLNLV
eukprot:TRINITY_DN2078_c0_g1_i1.p1 TRINITY_DN2078_c0_g1~~TRINITY_DN2078_c0_g1_i1.p1  ORF type:complete len:411 (+),score=82.26 TRINITY_DN2078_c0_g1_i1:47-1279(+)